MPSPNTFDYSLRGELAKSGDGSSLGLDYALRGEAIRTLNALAIPTYSLTPDGVATNEVFGVCAIASSYTLAPAGAGSLEAAGAPDLLLNGALMAGAIASEETIGVPIAAVSSDAYVLEISGAASEGVFGAPSFSGAIVNQGALVTQIGAEIAATAQSGRARVTAAHVEVAAQMSGGQVRATVVHAEIAAAMSSARVRVTAISRETAAWMSGAKVRVTALNIEYALGPLPPGVMVPPQGAMIDPLPSTCDCCADKWTLDTPPTVSWSDSAPPATPWNEGVSPPTVWTTPDCC